VLATELPLLRPWLHILPVDPADLDAAVYRFRPVLVICSQLREALRGQGTAWILLYPEGADQALIAVAEQSQVLTNPRLADLLAAIDAVTGTAPTRA
jgi:hypothetical protein